MKKLIKSEKIAKDSGTGKLITDIFDGKKNYTITLIVKWDNIEFAIPSEFSGGDVREALYVLYQQGMYEIDKF